MLVAGAAAASSRVRQVMKEVRWLNSLRLEIDSKVGWIVRRTAKLAENPPTRLLEQY